MLSRRRFLGLAGGAAVSGTALWATLLRDQVDGAPSTGTATTTSTLKSATDLGRILVVVQLSGGNDGLNTLVPMVDGRYRDARPGLAVPEADVVALSGTTEFGLHPALAPLGAEWDAER